MQIHKRKNRKGIIIYITTRVAAALPAKEHRRSSGQPRVGEILHRQIMSPPPLLQWIVRLSRTSAGIILRYTSAARLASKIIQTIAVGRARPDVM